MLGDCPCQQRYPLSSLGLILILFKGTILQPIFFLILKYSKKKDLDLLPTDVTLCLWIFFLFQLAEQITTPHSSLCKETPPPSCTCNQLTAWGKVRGVMSPPWTLLGHTGLSVANYNSATSVEASLTNRGLIVTILNSNYL